MKSERGALVRGSDPPSGHSVHKTTDDRWRVPARRLIQTHLGAAVYKTGDKILDPSPMAKNRPFFRFGRGAFDAAGNFSPPKPRIHLTSSRPSSTFTDLASCPTRTGLAVGCLYVETEGLSSRELFLISVLTIFNVKAQVPPRTAA